MPTPPIVIFGNSGSGKSTLAKHLAAALGCTRLDLDTIVWVPGEIAVERPRADAIADLDAFCSGHRRWIVEGCYGDMAEAALRWRPALLLLDPGVEVCLLHCTQRAFEAHKYATRATQDAMLPMLLDWVRAYYERDGPCSLAYHRAVFDRYDGPKQWVTTP